MSIGVKNSDMRFATERASRRSVFKAELIFDPFTLMKDGNILLLRNLPDLKNLIVQIDIFLQLLSCQSPVPAQTEEAELTFALALKSPQTSSLK